MREYLIHIIIKTAMIELKTILWLVATGIFIVYNIWFNPDERGYIRGLEQIFRFGISLVLYLIFWIVWLIIFSGAA